MKNFLIFVLKILWNRLGWVELECTLINISLLNLHIHIIILLTKNSL